MAAVGAAFLLRQGPSGAPFKGPPGNVLTMADDGEHVFAAPVSGIGIDTNDVFNLSHVPGESASDALDNLGVNPNFPAEHDNGTSGAAISISFAGSLAQKVTLTANCTLTVTGLIAGRTQWPQLKVVQGGGGSFTLTIVGAKTPGGSGLTLSTAVGSVDLVSMYWDGSALDALIGGLAFS